MEPLVSVLLPVYNGEAYLRDAIESVLAQDYGNFEFIVVDNASTDETAAIIADYAGDGRMRVIRNEKTLPRLENFAKAFDAAAPGSAWLKFTGDDDRLFPDCLREMVRAGEAHQGAGLVCSHYYNGDCLVIGVVPEEDEAIGGPQLLRRMLLEPEARSTVFSPTSVLLSHRVYREMGGFRTDLLHADAELFYRILDRYDLAYVHRPLMAVGYHGGSGQAVSTEHGDTYVEAYLIRYRNLGLYGNVKLSAWEVEKIKHNLAVDSVGFMLARTTKGDLRAAAGHLSAVPPAALYHLPLALVYFAGLAVKKVVRREPFRLLAGERRPR